jgi:hypothetical protein
VYSLAAISYLQWKKNHLYGAILCCKEPAVEKERHGISTTTLHLYLRVPGLNSNQDTHFHDWDFHAFPRSLQANAGTVPVPVPSKSLPAHHHSKHFVVFSKLCVISVMGIGLLHHLRKHITCIIYSNKNNSFVS